MGCDGLQWGIFEELPPDQNCHVRMAAMGCNGRNFEELPLTKIATKEWAAMGCNRKNFEKLPHHQTKIAT